MEDGDSCHILLQWIYIFDTENKKIQSTEHTLTVNQ